jgi:hypothetical protein
VSLIEPLVRGLARILLGPPGYTGNVFPACLSLLHTLLHTPQQAVQLQAADLLTTEGQWWARRQSLSLRQLFTYIKEFKWICFAPLR